VAWPAGASGLVAFFAPQNGINGSLGIEVVNSSINEQLLHGIYDPRSESSSGLPDVGITTLLHFNTSAVLSLTVLGSIRTIRDFTEGPSILQPSVQDSLKFATRRDGGLVISRLWFDNATTTQMWLIPTADSSTIAIDGQTARLEAGTYRFYAVFDYAQLEPLSNSVLSKDAGNMPNPEDSSAVQSLELLSYTKGLLAGAWKFLTYFGRDSMIATLLLKPVLSDEGIEAALSAVLERLNSATGDVCHEETIGDYATLLNLQRNLSGPEATKPGCTYQMIDTNYYLPIVLEAQFLESPDGQKRASAFRGKKAILDFGNVGLTYGKLAEINAAAVMNATQAFAQTQIKENLIHIKKGEVVGQWRDTSYGIGGGRIPYDVNSALAPAALQSVSRLSDAGWYPNHDWSKEAADRARVFEEHSLDFFKVVVPREEARSLVVQYAKSAGYGFLSNSAHIDADVIFHGLSLDGNSNQPIVRVMNTDDCFRLFLLTNTTNQTQLTAFLNQTATNIREPFPVGLMSSIGLFIANPAYGGDPVYAKNFTGSVYHGVVVWSWQLAMMAAGLERQLLPCFASGHSRPDFCRDAAVYGNVLAAYNELWDSIEANKARLESELWSWVYENGEFRAVPLSTLPPLPGEPQTEESDIRQLWSLAFLAVKRNAKFQ
ncbi:hypothetical protein HII31_03946, partial [Pseudocercospora fuligena]